MNGHSSIRILVIDDHPVTRAGLSAVITRCQGMCIVGEASDGFEAISLYRQHRPDVVLMDMSMPVMGGLQSTRAIRKEFPTARVLVLSVSAGDETIYQAIQAGAKGYLLKETTSTVMLESIRAVVAGQTVLPPEIASQLMSRLPMQDLTAREREVLEHIVVGKSNGEIGDSLFISEGTVKSHVNRILSKLKVTDRTQAALSAVRRGFAVLN